MNQDSATKAVLLDALGTLIELEPVAPRLAAALGIANNERVEAAVKAEIGYYRQHMAEGRDAASIADLRERCAKVASDELGVEVSVEKLLESLSFRAYPEVPGALAALRERGLRLVVVSNWDAGLEEILERCGLMPYLDGVVTSAGAGVAKPEMEIFNQALALAGCEPGEAVHVGDTYEADVVGARSSGIDAVLIDRSGATAAAPMTTETGATVHTITSLHAVPGVVDERGLWRSGLRSVDDAVETDPMKIGWGIGRVLLGIGAGLFTLILLATILAGVVGEENSADTAATVAGIALQTVIFIGMSIVFVWPGSWRQRLNKLGVRGTQLARSGRIPWRALGLVAGGLAVYLVLAGLYNLLFDPVQQDLTDDFGAKESTLGLVAAGIAIVVLAPLSEELLFRGFILRGVWNDITFWPAAVISSAAWAVVHLTGGDWAVVGQIFVLGMILAWMTRRAASIWPAIWLHAINNAIAFSVLVADK